MIALVGAASVLSTPIVGRLIDRKGSDFVNWLSFVGAILAAAILLGGQFGAHFGLIALAAGMLVLDVAVQCGQAANQSRVFALRPEARSRMNTAYMTSAFLGGSAGSWIGVRAYGQWGWPGVCALIALAATAALVRHAAQTFR